MAQTLLIISANPSDFVWEAGATVARYVKEGHTVHNIILTDGDRPEGGASREEVQQAASILGVASTLFCEYDPAPLVMDPLRCEELACRMREIRPDCILTHAKERDLDQPNNSCTAEAVRCAYTIASAAGAPCGGLAVSPRQTPMFGFEPRFPEVALWRPGFIIDATEFWSVKEQAMAALKSEASRIHVATEKAIMRGFHCSGRGGKNGCKYAEAFSSYGPIYAHGYFVW